MKGSNKDHVSAKSLKNEITGKIKAAINSAGGLAAKSIEKKIEKASKKLAEKVIKASQKLKKALEEKMRKSEKASSKGLKVASRKLASSKLVPDKTTGSLNKRKKSILLSGGTKSVAATKLTRVRTPKPKLTTVSAVIPATAPVRRRRSTTKITTEIPVTKSLTASTVKPTQTRVRKPKVSVVNKAVSTDKDTTAKPSADTLS